MLFSGSPSKPLILYSGTSKEKLEKYHLKHMGKSPETLESAQLDGRKEQPALTRYNRFYCLKQKLCHQCSPSRALELDRASLILHTAWNSGQPLSQQYTSTQYYCSNTIRWFSFQGKQSGTLLENYQLPQKSVLSSLSSPVLILPALAPEQPTKKNQGAQFVLP